MALVVDNATVGTAMAPIAEGALYADEIFIDGVTFTSKYDVGPAGEIQVVKYNRGATVLEPKKPGQKFTDEEYSNEVINIYCNNSFQKSVLCHAYYQATMTTNILRDKVFDVSEQVREGRQATGLATLVKEGTVVEDNTVLDVTNIKKRILGGRTTLRKKHAKPDVVFCSVETYSVVLEAAGKDVTPAFNDDIARHGKVVYWLGMLFVEVDLLDGVSSYKYVDNGGNVQTVDCSKVDFIMYDSNALSIIDKFVGMRVKDTEDAFGSKVQEEIDTGVKVTNADCVYVKKNNSVVGASVSEEPVRAKTVHEPTVNTVNDIDA